MGKTDNARDAYDKIIANVGELGPYQLRLICLAIVACIGMGVTLLITIFTMGAPEFRCAVPGMLNDTYEIQDEAHAHLVNLSIPYDSSEESYSQCYHYANQASGQQTNVTESCERWVYSKDVFKSSVIIDLNLVCDREIYISHTNMMSMAGLMIGSLLIGNLSDRFGRKKTFLFAYWLHLFAAVASAFVSSVWSLLLSRMALAGLGLAYYMSIYVLCMEMVAPRKRVLAGLICLLGWVGGMVTLLVTAYLVRDWRLLHLVTACPMVIVAVAYIWLVPESPRWLVNRGRYSEAQAILEDMARVNKVEIPEKLLRFDQEDVDNGKYELNDNGSGSEVTTVTPSNEDPVKQVLKSPTMVIRLVILCIDWMVNSMVYYGVTLNVGSIIEGDIYLNMLILTVLELFAYLLMYFVLNMNSIGRKPFFCACVLTGGAACITIIVPLALDLDTKWFNMILSNLGKLGITAAFGIIWIYTSELLPTPVRQTGIGLCSFVGRMGGMISPYIARLDTMVGGPLGKALPLVVFGASAVTAGVLSLLLPETANRKLPETVADAEAMKKNRKARDSSFSSSSSEDDHLAENGHSALQKL